MGNPARYPDAHPSGSPRDLYSLTEAHAWWNMHGPSSNSVQIFYRPHSRSDIVALLRERLPALAAALPLQRVVLFGSTAHERHTVASDIDLLVVYRGEPRPDAYVLVREVLDIRGVEPHCYASSEVAAMEEILARMTAGGIELPLG